MIPLILAAIVSVVVCAFARRFAGGLLGQWLGPIGGTQVARLAGASMVGAVVAWWAPAAWWGLAAVPLVFLGSTAGFPTGMVPRSWRDGAGLVAHGLMALAPLALGAWAAHASPWWLLGAGVARAPCYWLATLWQPYCPALGLNPDNAPDPPAFAEFMVGGLLGAAIVATLA